MLAELRQPRDLCAVYLTCRYQDLKVKQSSVTVGLPCGKHIIAVSVASIHLPSMYWPVSVMPLPLLRTPMAGSMDGHRLMFGPAS